MEIRSFCLAKIGPTKENLLVGFHCYSDNSWVPYYQGVCTYRQYYKDESLLGCSAILVSG
jgi:hypothetical protein